VTPEGRPRKATANPAARAPQPSVKVVAQGRSQWTVDEGYVIPTEAPSIVPTLIELITACGTVLQVAFFRSGLAR